MHTHRLSLPQLSRPRLLLLLTLLTLTTACHTPQPAAQPTAPPAPASPYAPLRTGALDATAVIQQALDREAADGGGEVVIPAGQFRIDGALKVPKGVTLRGVWDEPHHASLKTGTVLYVYGGRGSADGAPLVMLDAGAALRGMTIYYPEQNIDALTPYPWSVRVRGMHCTIENVTLVNPWQGIDLGTEWNELPLVRNVFGCPLKTGVYIDKCSDIGRLENVHFNPHYWFRDEGDGAPRPDAEKVMNHLVANADAFVFGRSDWQYVLNTFCYGYRAGYRFIKTPDGFCNGNFLGIGADGCENAVLVESASPIGVLITNGEFVSLRAANPIQVVTQPTNAGLVQFSNCAFWGPVNNIAKLEGGATSFVQCNFLNWDAKKTGLSAIDATAGSLIVQNSIFAQDAPQIHLGPKVTSAVIAGNIMTGGARIANESAHGDIQINGNAKR